MIYPSNAERIYYKRLAAYVRKIDVETRKRLIYKTDGFSEDLTAIIQFMLEFSASIMFELDDIYVMANEYNDRQFRLIVKKGTGIDLPSSATVTSRSRSALSSTPLDIQRKFGLGVDVYRIEAGLYDLQKNWIANNTQLIKTIPQQYLSRVEVIIRQGVMNGKNVKTLTKEIQALGQSTKNRARVIARDQITKANAELTRFRHQELGIKQYRWNTVRDERVRDSHLAHEGKVFSWSKPPATTGHPGNDVQCRCFSTPIFN